MKKKLNDNAPRLSRQQLADPDVGLSYAERLRRAGVAARRGELVIERSAEGYAVLRSAEAAESSQR